MSGINAGTMLAYLGGAAIFACAVLAVVYWSLQRTPPGYGLWLASCGLIGVACIVLADSDQFPRLVTSVIMPSVVTVAAVLRLEGIRRFFGEGRLALFFSVLTVASLALLAVFVYAWDSSSARGAVVAAVVTVAFWSTVPVLVRGAKRSYLVSTLLLAMLFAAYGALWLGSGIHWLVSGTGFPLVDVGIHAVVFLAAITAFEFIWLIACLVLSARWSTRGLEAARGRAEMERQQLADIVRFLPDAAFALDKDQRVIAWNEVIAQKTGVPSSAVVGMRWQECPAHALVGGATLSEVLLDPDKTVPPRCQDVRRDGDVLSAYQEWRHPIASDRRGHFWHMASLLRDSSGQVTGTIESIRDVTQLTEAERAVRENEERYRSLFDHSLDGILVMAPGGAVVDANPAACRMLGMTKEDICAAEPGGLISSADLTGESRTGTLVSGKALRELTFVRGDGSFLPVECASVVWTDSTGHLRALAQFRDISERIEARKILRESEAKLLASQSVPRLGDWEMDLIGQSIWMSPAALRIFGIEGHSPYFPLEASTIPELAEEPDGLIAALQSVMKDGGSYDVEYLIRRFDTGEARKVRSVGAAVLGESGAPAKIVGATLDITDREDLAGVPDVGLNMIEHGEDQVFWIDSEGNVVNVNESACVQLGYSRDELLTMTICDINPTLSPDSTHGVDELKGVRPRRYETFHRSKDGSLIPVDVTLRHAKRGDEDFKFVVAHDVSERKRLEDALRRTQISLGRGSDTILWADSLGRVTYATDAACRRLGLSREELLVKTLFDIGLAESGDWEAVWAGLRQQRVLTRERVFHGQGGIEVPLHLVLSQVEYEGDECALIAVHDVLPVGGDGPGGDDQDLGRLQHEKLEAVGQLAGGIAHDFNNLLTAIIGYDNLILADEGAQNSRSLRRDAEEIRDAAERAATLTSQILAFARRQPLRPRKLDLGKTVSALEASLRSLVSDDIELAMDCSLATGVVEVDADQFERVVFNLVGNASEAMQEGGRLLIRVEDIDLSEEYCRVYPELQAGPYVMLSVSDTGVGMDADTKARVFEPFFTTKPPGEGSGLGLSVAYGIVRQSGGYVVIYSEMGEGTTVKIYLPRLGDPADALVPEPALDEAGAKSGATILVVEDEPPLRRLVARVLSDAGYRVFVAGSGSEALEAFEDMEPPPDLLLTDVVLPGGLRGNQVASKIAASVPGLAVLYMSGHPLDAIGRAGRLDEGVGFLGKPFTPQGLLARVVEALDASRS